MRDEWGYKIDKMLACMARAAVLDYQGKAGSRSHLDEIDALQIIRTELKQKLGGSN